MTFGVSKPDFPAGCAVLFGASGGLGSVTARLMAERGSHVVLTYSSRAAEAAEVVADIERHGGQAMAVQCDVRERASIDAVVAAAVERFGAVHSVLSSQGFKYATGVFAEADPDGVRRKFEIDVIGFLNICQATIPPLRENGGGSILAIVSPAITRFVPGYGLGATPKAGVVSMVKYFAGEEGRNNIRVNAVAPGVINAGMAIKLSEGPAKEILDRAVAATPLGRLGEAAEVAELLTFLASAKAGYVTGQVVMIDGGFSL
ncbi:SDR family NAD(P)-dependent oxidoreductase [Nitrobacter sp.]|uniref:SDR family NAD(P)-dependent oxidoreductase n=1 Tax=Nitrobacter sp. TaxID=29420 RepID=UPI0029CAAC72|nr:SDR family oxidoreductase [Nitrobacter sp.]